MEGYFGWCRRERGCGGGPNAARGGYISRRAHAGATGGRVRAFTRRDVAGCAEVREGREVERAKRRGVRVRACVRARRVGRGGRWSGRNDVGCACVRACTGAGGGGEVDRGEMTRRAPSLQAGMCCGESESERRSGFTRARCDSASSRVEDTACGLRKGGEHNGSSAHDRGRRSLQRDTPAGVIVGEAEPAFLGEGGSPPSSSPVYGRGVGGQMYDAVDLSLFLRPPQLTNGDGRSASWMASAKRRRGGW